MQALLPEADITCSSRVIGVVRVDPGPLQILDAATPEGSGSMLAARLQGLTLAAFKLLPLCNASANDAWDLRGDGVDICARQHSVSGFRYTERQTRVARLGASMTRYTATSAPRTSPQGCQGEFRVTRQL